MRAETDWLSRAYMGDFKTKYGKGIQPYLKGHGLEKNAGGQQLTIKTWHSLNQDFFFISTCKNTYMIYILYYVP